VYSANIYVGIIAYVGEGGDSKDLRNVGIAAYIFTEPLLRNRIHISIEPLCKLEIFSNLVAGL
jgi:hypothetical protein